MLKRTAAILLTILYAITAFGFVLNMHYCGRLLTSVEINSPSKNCVKTERKMKCCNDKQLQVKIKDAHQAKSFSFLSKTFVFELPPMLFGNPAYASQQSSTEVFLSRGPPNYPPGNIPIFIKNQSFRI